MSECFTALKRTERADIWCGIGFRGEANEDNEVCHVASKFGWESIHEDDLEKRNNFRSLIGNRLSVIDSGRVNRLVYFER